MISPNTLRSCSRLALALAATSLVACAHTPSPSAGPDLRPLPEPARALELIREAGGKRQNLRALGRLTYFGEKGRVRLKAALLVERPGRFRFETISPLEQPVDVMACDGDRQWLLSKEKLSEGAATPENVARLLPLPMEPEDVVDTLLGGVPTSDRFTPSKIAWSDDRWVLTVASGDGDAGRLTIEPATKRVVAMDLLQGGGDVRVSVSFEDFEDAGEGFGEVPRKIGLRMPGRDLDVDIRLKEVDVNVALKKELFRIDAPPGVRPEPLDAPAASFLEKPSR
jgi:outer membrane lipoprotein-sorting protein